MNFCISSPFLAIYEEDEGWIIGYCPEIPGANGQGKTQEECRMNLIEAVKLIIEDRRDDALKGVPEDAKQEILVIA